MDQGEQSFTFRDLGEESEAIDKQNVTFTKENIVKKMMMG